MNDQQSPSAPVLRSIWTTDEQRAAFDEECGPTKTCRNMKDVTFDGMAEPGSDLSSAWRDLLAREGKLGSGGATIRDLVLGGADEDR